MPKRKGFTLIEITIVLIIIGLLAAVAVPSYNVFIQQGAAQTAQNNLITIYNAEKNFYLSNTNIVGTGTLPYYCSTSIQNTTCADTLVHLNLAANLNLNITDNNFSYSCSDPNSGTDGNNGSSFSCTATNNSAATFTFVLKNSPIVLRGGTSCTSYGGAGCNPTCTYAAHTNYCPS